jgi:hypothetical protein
MARIAPCAARHAASRTIAYAVDRHKREVNDFAFGTKSRRGPPAALPGAGEWRRAWGDGAHFPCAARHAANDNIFPPFRVFFVFSAEIRKGPRGGWHTTQGN